MKLKVCVLVLLTAISITLFSAPALGAEASFRDTSGHWAEAAISSVVEKNLFQGTGPDTFSPDGSMTRGMFVAVLGRLAQGMGYDVSGRPSFSDVSVTAYYGPYVAWAYKNGIVEGTGGGRFSPDLSVTREQMCALFVRFLAFVGYPMPEGDGLSFTDEAAISAYAVRPVETAVALGLINGYAVVGGMEFRPAASATRAEVATVFLRLYGLPGFDIGDIPSPAEEARIAAYLAQMLAEYEGMSYIATTDKTVQDCFRILMSCIRDALNERNVNGALLTRDYVRKRYASSAEQIKRMYREEMSEDQKVQFENVAIRFSNVYTILEYFGVSVYL